MWVQRGCVGGKVFRNLAGCCCDQKGGQFWFPLQGVQSELCMAEDEFFPKYETEKKIPAHSQTSLFLSLSCGRFLLSMAALSEVPCSTRQRTVRHQENISVQPNPHFLFFSFQPAGITWNGYLSNFRHGTATGTSRASPLMAAHPQAPSAPHSKPLGALLNPLGMEGLPFPGVFVGRELPLEAAEPAWGMSSSGQVAQPGTSSFIEGLLGNGRNRSSRRARLE